MTYSASTPPFTAISLPGFRLWVYINTDATTTVDGANYFTDGYTDLGMREGDLLYHYKTGTGGYFYYCNEASATTVDFTNALVLTATDSD